MEVRQEFDARRQRWLAVAGGLFGALGVLIGAGVAHGLSGWLEDQGLAADLVSRRLDNAETAVRYHLLHSLLLLVLFSLRGALPGRWLTASGILAIAGIVLFSGSLYALVLLEEPRLGAVTPLGGLSFVAAWLVIAAAAIRIPRPNSRN